MFKFKYGFILERVSCDELTEKINDESEKKEKRREDVLKWGDSIEMAGALAPSIGSRLL